MLKKLLFTAVLSASLWAVFAVPGRSISLRAAQTSGSQRQTPAPNSGARTASAARAGTAATASADSSAPDSLTQAVPPADSLLQGVPAADSLSTDGFATDSLSADSLTLLRDAADSLVLSDRELDSLQRLGETHHIDTIIMATPREIPKRPNEWDLKWNMIMGAYATPFFGFSFAVGDQWTLEFDGSYNAWNLKNERHWKHGQGSFGARFWTKDREEGHFVGAHVLGGVYNLNRVRLPYQSYPSMEKHRYEGWGVGGGFSYGYRWNFSERWAMEGELGLGYVYAKYDKFACDRCGEKIESGNHGYIGPTKVALNLIYRFGKKKREEYKRAIAPRPVPIIRERIVRDTIIREETITKIDTLVQTDTVEIEAPMPVVSNKGYTLHIQYRSGTSLLQPTYMDNEKELRGFMQVLDSMLNNKNITINSIRAIGYASIEGAEATNMRLSQARAAGLADYLRTKYPDLRRAITSEGQGEDWDGFDKALDDAIGLEGKDAAQNIIRTGTTQARKGRLMQLDGGRFWRYALSEIMPKLRRIEVKIGYTEIKMQKTRRAASEAEATATVPTP